MGDEYGIDGSSVAAARGSITQVRGCVRIVFAVIVAKTDVETRVEYSNRGRRFLKFSKGTCPRRRERPVTLDQRPLSRQWGPTREPGDGSMPWCDDWCLLYPFHF